MRRVDGLNALLNTLPHYSMDPSSHKNLLNILSKVARYREAARFLYRTAKKIPLIRRTKIFPVNLPKEVSQSISRDQNIMALPDVLPRIDTRNGQSWKLNNVCRLLKTDPSLASGQFVDRTHRTLREAKIHADIQLVLHMSRRPPRVICSSKDACFLCNAFILMYIKIRDVRLS